MRKTVTIEGTEISLATITVGDLETIELSGKSGRKFNIALVAVSILAAGDTERGTEEWVRTVHAFSDVPGGEPPFQMLIAAANEVNGLSAPKPKGETEPAAPAAE